MSSQKKKTFTLRRTMTYESICVKKSVSMETVNSDCDSTISNKGQNQVMEEKNPSSNLSKLEMEKLTLENKRLHGIIKELTASNDQLKKMYTESLLTAKSTRNHDCHWICEEVNSLVNEFNFGWCDWKTMLTGNNCKKLIVVIGMIITLIECGKSIANSFCVYIILELVEALLDISYCSTSIVVEVIISMFIFLAGKYLFLSSPDILPWCVPNTMHTVWSTMARIVAMLAPQTILLMRYWYDLPSIIAGALSVAVGISIILVLNSTTCKQSGVKKILNISKPTYNR